MTNYCTVPINPFSVLSLQFFYPIFALIHLIVVQCASTRHHFISVSQGTFWDRNFLFLWVWDGPPFPFPFLPRYYFNIHYPNAILAADRFALLAIPSFLPLLPPSFLHRFTHLLPPLDTFTLPPPSHLDIMLLQASSPSFRERPSQPADMEASRDDHPTTETHNRSNSFRFP
jgi:hypothetical protein